ncbi:Undecaprenyl-phosphate alpha-N-acetylglucosaminyl 1-phosphate transferase (plasmid) [Streptomyces sp. enrichment culture]|uniref:MraY family glycosyltransferase n=1 Tax=Streptomyces sp. enrichment culture TaxID=1795815 RepID=UPI003F56A49D
MSTAAWTAAAGAAALLLALVLTEPLRRFALRNGITDRPNARKAHPRPTPCLGGVAVAVATLGAGTAAAFARGVLDPTLAVLLGGGAIVCVLGLVDDLRQLGPGIRLYVETSAAAAVVLVGGHPTLFGGAFDTVLAVLWIVFTTNAFNLLDNMDGVASSLCAVIGGVTCLTAEAGGLGVVTAALAGACLGFLFHNRHPARIFLGDAGSLFLGFTLCSAVVVLHRDADGLSGPVVLLLATLIPTVDTALVMTSRYRESRPLLQGGTDHMTHRLRRTGMTVPQIVWALSLVAALSCLFGVLVTHGVVTPAGALVAAILVAVAAVRLLLKIPSTAGLSPRTVVRAGAAQHANARTTVPARLGGTLGRRLRPARPTEVPHSREADETGAPFPAAGFPSTPKSGSS